MGKNYVSLTNVTGGLTLATEMQVAANFSSRLRGLLGRPELKPGEGLWIKPCNGVHMFFMRFAIDVLFLNARLQVVKVIANLQPWQISPVVKGAKSVVELPAGSTTDKVAVGDQLAVQ